MGERPDRRAVHVLGSSLKRCKLVVMQTPATAAAWEEGFDGTQQRAVRVVRLHSLPFTHPHTEAPHQLPHKRHTHKHSHTLLLCCTVSQVPRAKLAPSDVKLSIQLNSLLLCCTASQLLLCCTGSQLSRREQAPSNAKLSAQLNSMLLCCTPIHHRK
jgi:hypothetical protein